MATILDILKVIKEITNDVKGLADKALSNEIMSKLLEVQETILDVREENDNLKKKIAELENSNSEPEFLKKVQWRNDGTGVFETPDGNRVRICMHCSLKTGKPMILADQMRTYYCPECKTTFVKRSF